MFKLFHKKDTQLQQDVMDELKWDPKITSTDITVTAKDGIVTLSGSVPHYLEKTSAEEAAQRVSGVHGIADEMEVKLLGSFEKTDEEVARAALDALKWSYSVPDGIKVTVDNGWVTLSGDAEWDFERNSAKNTVANLLGVRGVSNDIQLKNKILPTDVQTLIEDALKRSAENESQNITVTVTGSRVHLSGTVHSFSEMEDARIAAWSAPGVMSVEDNLKIAA